MNMYSFNLVIYVVTEQQFLKPIWIDALAETMNASVWIY